MNTNEIFAEGSDFVLGQSNLPIIFKDPEKEILKIYCTPNQQTLIKLLFGDILDDKIAEYVVVKSSEEPQRCPICGGESVTMIGEYNAFPSGQRGYYVECKGCGMRTGYHRTEEKAIKSWNRHVKQALERINRKD